MKMARFHAGGAQKERLGIVTLQQGREVLLDVAKAAMARGGNATAPTNMMALIEGGVPAMEGVRELLAWANAGQDPAWLEDPDQVAWLTPVPPRSMFCAGRNFGRHKMESAKGNLTATSKLHSDFPTGFTKIGRTLVPHLAKVARPVDVTQLDYEVEVALVIGKAIDAHSKDLALAHGNAAMQLR